MSLTGVADVFSKIPHNPNPNSHQLPDVDIEVDNEILSQSVKDAHVETGDHDTTDNSKETDRGATTVQMAFLRLMTEKVLKATANCPDAIKLLNTAIRQDKD